ncbi:MAG: ketoacyl-ACP synthase III [Bacteroidetes bacterium]|nr:ketoacyl-ACP synthase III [Bacteroidota bacterium]MBL6944247.1 ketoacyl-ACP synthase III [Bacteroidales bacterium]
MAIFQVPNINIAGISACVPEDEYNNNNYDWISEKERETLIKTIGVETKRHAKKGTTTSDLCFVAADSLINKLGWNRSEIDLLIFVSQSRDYIIPATSGLLQEKLSLSKSCVAFDISLGCSGYIYGLSVIGSMMATGRINKGFLLTGDISTLNTSFKDKSAFPLFGDAGTATAIELSNNAEPMMFHLQTDGSGYDAIIIPDGGIRNFADKDSSFEYKNISEGIFRNNFNIALDGIKVFNFSLREVKPNITKLLQEFELTIDDIDYFVFHQANKLMNETIRKQLKLDPAKVPYSLKEFGNTSSASIPLTIVTELSKEVKNSKLTFLLSGFGVGLSWGSVILQIDKIVCPSILTYKD